MAGILENKKLQDFLDSQSFNDLSWIMGRYCGPNNEILFDKTYGEFGVKQRDFHREVQRRLFSSLLEEELSSGSDTIKE